MRLKLDEDLGNREAEMLRQAGHDVSTVPEQGLRGAPDRSIIEICRRQERCLVSLDREFGNPLLFRPSDYHGIATIRLPPQATPGALADGVRTLIEGLNRNEIAGRLWTVQPGRIREYEPEEDDDNGQSTVFTLA